MAFTLNATSLPCVIQKGSAMLRRDRRACAAITLLVPLAKEKSEVQLLRRYCW